MAALAIWPNLDRERLSTPFRKYVLVLRSNRSLTVAAPIRAARVSKRFPDTLVNF